MTKFASVMHKIRNGVCEKGAGSSVLALASMVSQARPSNVVRESNGCGSQISESDSFETDGNSISSVEIAQVRPSSIRMWKGVMAMVHQ